LCSLTSFEKKNPPKNDFTITVQRLTVYEGRLEVVIPKQLMKRKQRWKFPSPSLLVTYLLLKGSKKSPVNKKSRMGTHPSKLQGK
jgi:hypothetical protein